MKKEIIQARRCFNKMAFTAVSMKLEFWSLFLNKEISSIFETDLVATSQTNSESGGKVGVIIIIYSFLFYGLFSRLGSLLRMFCSPCFSWVINCSTPEITENSDDKTGIRLKKITNWSVLRNIQLQSFHHFKGFFFYPFENKLIIK